MPGAHLPPLAQALLEPRIYPHRPARVALVQTHISYVFLAGDQVYKVKKPVRFAFLDFSTLERRRHFCHEEVRLNRRLAGDVYRGVVALRATADGYALADEACPDAVEYAVHMHRLPAERMLPVLLANHSATPAMIDAAAERLVEFHAAAECGGSVRAGGDPAVITRLMNDDFGECASFHGRTIDAADDAAIQAYCHAFVRRHEALLRHRQAEDRIRDGHGDLHTEHLCFTDGGLVIFDCVEFNPAFRHRDVAAEIAFLSMDLTCCGRADLASRLVARYAERTGDRELPHLVPFYACHRAYIRGKVESLKSVEPEVAQSDREAAAQSAVRHFALALRYTWSGVRALVVVGGLSGSGKSTVAAALAARTGFAHLNSDVLRKRLAGVAATDRPGASLYTPEQNARTYRALYDGAAAALAEGHGVIVDATFQRHVDRDRARAVADAAGVPLLFVECRCDEDELRRRLAARTAHGDNPSDADWDVYLRQRARYEPYLAADADHLAVDTTRADVVQTVESRLRAVTR